MRKLSFTNSLLIGILSKKLKKIGRKRLSRYKDSISERKSFDKVARSLDRWLNEGKLHECYDSLEDIIEDLGVTHAELKYFCAMKFGKPFLTWRKELRMEEAKELLRLHPEIPICHIAFDLGFSDKSNFRKQFKDIVGCTPSEWRAEQIKDKIG